MLQRGGNAVDAALATAIALTVVEPCSNGIGSDLFAIVWDGRELVGLNASGRAPAAVTPQRYAGQTEMPQRGWEAVTIPGAVSAWAALSQRFGALPFADLFAPAIRYARDGYAVSPVVAEKWARGRRRCCRTTSASPSTSCRAAARRSPARCSRCPAMARTLESIAATRGNAFYRGELAQAMVAHAQRARRAAHAGRFRRAHACDWVDAARARLRAARPCTRSRPTARASRR